MTKQQFLVKVRSRIETTAQDEFAYGIHSQIPLCCVEFFCNRIRSGKSPVAHLVKLERGLDPGELNGIMYVQCDTCFKENRVVKIHMCTEECER